MLFKYLHLVALFQDVTCEVQADGVAKRPWYLQRTFYGASVALIAGVISVIFGVSLDSDLQTVIADGITQIVPVVITFYGIAMTLYGAIMKAINAVKAVQQCK